MAQVNNSSALRCIGQDFARRGIKSFDIRYLPKEKEYLIQGGYQDPPAQTPVTIVYRPADLDELDGLGTEKRGQSAVSAVFLSQAQLFRTVGGFLDKSEAQLVHLTNNELSGGEPSLKVEYINSDRERVVDSYTGANLYGMCITMYKQRGKMTATYDRFSRLQR
ncbi:MAG: hypothetical protein EXR70_22025 [Deltaproteobacteria bacterium]|nr:hypothetical protein [Deltaproteobacteria bacterium]